MSQRFVKATPGLIQQDIFYREPVELIQQAMAAKQQEYDTTEAALDNADRQFMSKITGPKFRNQDVNNIRDTYKKRVNELVTQLQESGSDGKLKQSLRSLQQDFMKDYMEGDISKLRGLEASIQANQKTLKDHEGDDNFVDYKTAFNKYYSDLTKDGLSLDDATKITMQDIYKSPEALEDMAKFVKNMPTNKWSNSFERFIDANGNEVARRNAKGKIEGDISKADLIETVKQSGNNQSSKVIESLINNELNTPEAQAYMNMRKSLYGTSINDQRKNFVSEGLAYRKLDNTNSVSSKFANGFGKNSKAIKSGNSFKMSPEYRVQATVSNAEDIANEYYNLIGMDKMTEQQKMRKNFIERKWQMNESLNKYSLPATKNILNKLPLKGKMTNEEENLLQNMINIVTFKAGTAKKEDIDKITNYIKEMDEKYFPETEFKSKSILGPNETEITSAKKRLDNFKLNKYEHLLQKELDNIKKTVKDSGEDFSNSYSNISSIRKGIRLNGSGNDLVKEYETVSADYLKSKEGITVYDGRFRTKDYLTGKQNTIDEDNQILIDGKPTTNVYLSIERKLKDILGVRLDKNINFGKSFEEAGLGTVDLSTDPDDKNHDLLNIRLKNDGKSMLGLTGGKDTNVLTFKVPKNITSEVEVKHTNTKGWSNEEVLAYKKMKSPELANLRDSLDDFMSIDLTSMDNDILKDTKRDKVITLSNIGGNPIKLQLHAEIKNKGKSDQFTEFSVKGINETFKDISELEFYLVNLAKKQNLF